jgi:acyl carrier protein
MTPTINQQVHGFLADRLGIDVDDISDSTSYNSLILRWMAAEQGVPVEMVDDPAGEDGIRDSAGGELVVLMDLEKEFDFEMTLEEAQAIRTVGDIAALVERYARP